MPAPKSAKSKSGAVMEASAISALISVFQRALPTWRLFTCRLSSATSKEGRPEAYSTMIFWRCCCSGTTSMPQRMPVRSSNSLLLRCSSKPRGDVCKVTSMRSPAKRFQSKRLCALACRTKAGAPSKAAVAPSAWRRVMLLAIFWTLPIAGGFGADLSGMILPVTAPYCKRLIKPLPAAGPPTPPDR